MYVQMLDALLNTPEKVSHGREGFFFGENGELVTGEIVKAIAKALFSLGRISSPELVQQSPEELGRLYGSEVRTVFPPEIVSLTLGWLRCRCLYVPSSRTRGARRSGRVASLDGRRRIRRRTSMRGSGTRWRYLLREKRRRNSVSCFKVLLVQDAYGRVGGPR